MQIYRWNRQGHVSFISFASWRTRFLDKASVVNQLPSARFLSARLSKHTCIIGTFGLVCLNPIVREKSIESFATTGAHDYHIHVRETIFVFGWAHGRRKGGGQGGLASLDFKIVFFLFIWGRNIFFLAVLCGETRISPWLPRLWKNAFGHHLEKSTIAPSWKKTFQRQWPSWKLKREMRWNALTSWWGWHWRN